MPTRGALNAVATMHAMSEGARGVRIISHQTPPYGIVALHPVIERALARLGRFVLPRQGEKNFPE